MNNTNPNENLNENSNGVTPNTLIPNNDNIEELGNTSSLNNVVGEINSLSNNPNNTATTNINDTNSVEEIVADRIDLFGNKEKKDTAVIMSRQAADKLEAERRKARESEEAYVPKEISKGKYAAMIVFFIFMFAFVIFLPDISTFISLKKAEEEQKNAPVITTGSLTCTLSRTSDAFNLDYTAVFEFTDSKLDKLIYTSATKGDAVVDEIPLANLLNKCETLQEEVYGNEGVRVECSQSGGMVVETQTLNYSTLNVEKVTAAYIEAGGVYPEFKKEQDIDVIEKNMNASGYTCERRAE